MTYERPMMQAEVYATNAYCGACEDNPTPNKDIIRVDHGTDGQNWIGSFNWGPGFQVTGTNPWSANGTNYDLSHEFTSDDRISMTNPNTNQQQWYWKCTCGEHDDGSATGSYYLEYSADWTTRLGDDSFVLFKENTDNTSLQVGTKNTFPAKPESTIDTAIAMVTYTNPMIANS